MAYLAQINAARTQFLDENGDPLVGGTIETYIPGTFTPVTTYQEPDGSPSNTNPITLDDLGSAAIWYRGLVRMIVKDVDGNQLYDQVGGDDIDALLADYALTDLSNTTSTALTNLDYYAPGSGTVAHAMSLIVGETRVSLADKDGSGDGSTDNTSAFNACVASIVGTGGKIYIPPGDWRFGSATTPITQNDIEIIGVYGASKVRPTFQNGNLFQFGSNVSITKRIKISNLYIQPTVTSLSGALIAVDGAGYVVISDIQTVGGWDAVVVDTYGNQAQLWIERCGLEDGGRDAIRLGKNSSTVVNGIHLSHNIIAGFAGGAALRLGCVGGLYADNVESYECDTGTVFDPNNDGIFGAWFEQCLNDSAIGTGWLFTPGTAGRVADIHTVNCSAATCGRGLDVNLLTPLNGLELNGFVTENNDLEGAVFNAGKNIQMIGGAAWCNSQSGSAAAAGIQVGAAVRKFTALGVSSGLGGTLEEGGVANLQSYGFAVDNFADEYMVSHCRAIGNVTGGFFGTSGTAAKQMLDNRTI